MAGQIASLPLSIQLDDNARPLSGCLLYLYDAGTSTPAVFYEDFSTSIVLSWPLVADTSGRIPLFWVADGSYRVRLTDNAGSEIFDINSITAVGPSSGTGGGSSVSTDQIFQTGDPIWLPINATRSGWVRGNALTIGSSSSGASERANADCQALFEYFWNTFADSLCPVTGGRGANALTDWNANKRIATLDMRGRGAYGLDTMGNSAASVIATATSAAVALGQETKSIVQANLPNVGFTISGTAASHTHGVSGTTSGQSNTHTHSYQQAQDQGNPASIGGGTARLQSNSSATSGNASADHTHTFNVTSAASGALSLSGTAASGGSGTALATLSPGRAGTWFFKL